MAAVDIPKQYKAIVYDKPGQVSTKVETLDMPEPEFGQVLINLTHSGVCHSDYGVMMNSWSTLPFPTQPGQVGGHEGVGKVVKMGPGTENSAVKVGDRVGVKWISMACGGCLPCLNGRDGLCLNQKISGYYTPGTFQQYVTGPANYVTPIPDGISSEDAAPMLCAGVTVYSALRKSGLQSGQWCVILGAGGGLGHIACQIAAKAMNFRTVGIDADNKKDLVMKCGVEHFIGLGSAKEKKLDEQVKALTDGLGAHAVVVLTAANAAYATSLDYLRFGGRMVCVGIPEGKQVPVQGADPGSMITKELSIIGVAVGNRKDAMEVLDLAARGLVKVHARTEKMDKLSDVFHEMEEGKLQGRVVIDLQG